MVQLRLALFVNVVFLTNHRGAEYTETKEGEGKNCLTELYWIKTRKTHFFRPAV
jgi:hypothetical protein